MLLLHVCDVDMDELGQRDRERGLLEGEIPLEKLEEFFQVHREVPSQILDNLIHVSHVNQIELLRKGNCPWIGLIADLCFSLLFDLDEGLLKDIALAFNGCDHVVELGRFFSLYFLSQCWQLLLNHLIEGRDLAQHWENAW